MEQELFYPFTGLCRATSLLEWGCGCAFGQQSCLQSGKSSVVELEERQNKAQLHVKMVAAEIFIYVIFPTTFCNVEK